MATEALTDDVIAAAMKRAEQAISPPFDDICYGRGEGEAEALKARSPKGRCKIGWVVRDSGREAWDAWYNVHTGEGRLRRQSDP